MKEKLLSPLQRYQINIDQQELLFDAAQYAAVQKLDILFCQLIENEHKPSGFLNGLFNRADKPLLGLYMWGGVGRGKTYLMDSFYHGLPILKKKRMHFHRFMYWLHQQLKTLDGQSDPLIRIARKLAEDTQILCFDEFFVSDIADAMILAGLLDEMFKLGITLVATSNISPDRLYWNGLQRTRFLPAIDLLKQHTEILNVDGGIDYRLRTLEQAEIYHFPLDHAAKESLQFSFTHLAGDETIEDTLIIINGREIKALAMADGILWLDYQSVCVSPRSAKDFIELSKLYHSILIADIPQLDDAVNDQVRRFISLVDEFYERNVKLIISAAVALSELYTGTALAFEFERTQSRLQEMQSHSYLAKQHLP